MQEYTQLKSDFVNGSMSSENFVCNVELARAEVSVLETLMSQLNNEMTTELNGIFDAFMNIEAVKGGNKYKEDNLFYDIHVQGLSEASGNGENYDAIFKQYTYFAAEEIKAIIGELNKHIDAFEYYSERKEFPNVVNDIMSKIKRGKTDVKLSMEELTTLSRGEILNKYGITEEELAIDPNTIQFASDEERDNYFAALQYLNNDFYNKQKQFSVGNAEDQANKINIAVAFKDLLQAPATTAEDAASATTSGGATSATLTAAGEAGVASAKIAANAQNNSTAQPATTYRRTSTTVATQNSNVASADLSAHKEQMQQATNTANNTTAFENVNKKTDTNSNTSSNKTQDNTTSVPKVENVDTTITKDTPNSTNQVSNNTPISNPQTERYNYSNGNSSVENVQAAHTMSFDGTTTTPLPEIKDVDTLIAQAETSTTETDKIDPSKMVSSITNNTTPLKPIKIDEIKATQEESTSGKFIPPIAGVSAATVAGIGTKFYVDKNDKTKENTEENNYTQDSNEIVEEDIDFVNDDIEDDEEPTTMNEEILKMLDR